MNADDSQKNAKEAADLQMLEVLLQETLYPHPAAREARIQRVLDAQQGPAPAEKQAPSATSRGRRRWMAMAVAASLLLAWGLWSQSNSPSQQARAAVLRSLKQAQESTAGHYRLSSVVQWPVVGRREVEGDLWVDGADRFVVRHPALLRANEVWIGANPQEYWIVPPRGPVTTGGSRIVEAWLAKRERLATPYLHITTMLQRLSEGYELQMLPEEVIDDGSRPGEKVRCRRVQGTLLPSRFRPGVKKLLPKAIDLWADKATGFARRIVLDWQLPAKKIGCSRMTVTYAGPGNVTPDWFEHSSHHDNRRVISPGL